MYLMIDNYDSFVYNLSCYVRECGGEVLQVRNDQVNIQDIEAMQEEGNLEGIILSPGPKSPEDCGICRDIVKRFQQEIPILGVCLGHQIIGAVFGALIQKGTSPVHGKVHPIFHTGKGLFRGLPPSYCVTRYHSLIVSGESFPECMEVDARTGDGVLMGIHHKKFPVYGVQFHPEAVLTEYGHELLQNFIQICCEWRKHHAD